MQKLPLVLAIIGVTVGALALIFGFQIFPMLMKKKITAQSQLVNGTDKWESWRVVPIPVFQQIYIFNVTNHEEVMRGGKPILQELGPYVYQHKRTKVDISVDEASDTVSYKHKDSYFFRQDMTKGSLTDKIVVLNIPYLGAVYKSMLAGTAARYMVSETISEQFPDEDMYVKITVDEFLFGGYYVPLIAELSALRGETLMPNNTFGLYYAKNGSESLTYEIRAGVKEPEKFGSVVSYNKDASLQTFDDEKCDAVEGYDGSMMAPFLTRDKEFYLFVPNLCRKMQFKFDGDVEMGGIPAYKFTVPPFYLADVKTNPDNMCYCSNPGDEGEKCFKSGVWELSKCRQGTPMVMSFPHFYNADPVYLDQSVGLVPDQERHEMVVVLEPTAAISFKVAIRVQMNFAIKPTRYFKKLKNIPEMVHPIFWMDQGITLPPPVLQMVKDKLIKTQEIVRLGTYVGFGVGCLFLVIALLVCWCRSRKSTKTAYAPTFNTQKASIAKMKASESENTYSASPLKPDYTSEKYSKITSPPNPRPTVPEEERPFLPPQNGQVISSPPKSIPVPAPVISYRPHSPSGVRIDDANPSVVGFHPKIEVNHPSLDEPDENNGFPPPTSNRNPPLGVAFPQINQFSSSNSVNNDLNEIDNTLRDINDAVSSYENLK